MVRRERMVLKERFFKVICNMKANTKNGILTLAAMMLLASENREFFVGKSLPRIVRPETNDELRKRLAAEAIAKAQAKRARKAQKYRDTHKEDKSK